MLKFHCLSLLAASAMLIGCKAADANEKVTEPAATAAPSG